MDLKEYRVEVIITGVARVYARSKEEAEKQFENTRAMVAGNKMLYGHKIELVGPVTCADNKEGGV